MGSCDLFTNKWGVSAYMSVTLWRNHDFLKLLIGQGVSLLGSLISRVALPFFVIYTFSATPIEVAWLRVWELLPGLIVGVFVGVWVDRLSRRLVMLIVDIARALLVGLLPLLFFVQTLTVAEIMVVAALLSIATVSFESAYDAFSPIVVKENALVEANSRLTSVAAVAEVVGFSMSGVLYAVGGISSLLTARMAVTLFRRFGYGRSFLGASFLGVVGASLLPLAGGPLWLILLFILGQQILGDAGDTMFDLGLTSLRQSLTGNLFLGRVRSIWLSLTFMGLLLGILVGGELAGCIGLRYTLVVGVGVRLVMAVLVGMSRQILLGAPS